MSEEVKIPDKFLFTKEHEWIKKENSEMRVGITDHAQNQLGDIVFVELPTIGDDFAQYSKGDSTESELGAVESIKSVSTLYAPVSGKVTEVNVELEEKPEMVNEDPYGDGWICKMKIEDKEELEKLMDAEKYKRYLEEKD
ncbi:MAG: glycine cleavage system protein GcvH [Candidatus Hadarchaeota archaeon]